MIDETVQTRASLNNLCHDSYVVTTIGLFYLGAPVFTSATFRASEFEKELKGRVTERVIENCRSCLPRWESDRVSKSLGNRLASNRLNRRRRSRAERRDERKKSGRVFALRENAVKVPMSRRKERVISDASLHDPSSHYHHRGRCDVSPARSRRNAHNETYFR